MIRVTYPGSTVQVIRAVVVDDDPMIANMTAEFLQLWDIDVVGVFHNTPQCIQEIMNGLETDVVISDYDMGAVNGIELFETLELISPKIKKVMVTGNHYIAREVQQRWPTVLKGCPDFFNKLADMLYEKA